MNRRLISGVVLCAVVVAGCGSPESSEHYVQLTDDEAIAQIADLGDGTSLADPANAEGRQVAADWAEVRCSIWQEGSSDYALLGAVTIDGDVGALAENTEDAREFLRISLQWKCPEMWVEYAEAMKERGLTP